MGDSLGSARSAGAQDPGPEGAGFAYHPVERELIVVARPELAESGSPSGEPLESSALDIFLMDQQLALEPLFGSEARVREALALLPRHGADVPDLTLFHRVRGGEERLEELASRLAGLPGIETAYVKPSAFPATGPFGAKDDKADKDDADERTDEGRREKEGPSPPTSAAARATWGPRPRAWTRPGRGSRRAAPARA